MNTYLTRSKLTIAIFAFILFTFAGISSAQQEGLDKDNKDRGPYSVGSIAIFIHDPTRGFDPWAAIYDGDGNADGTINFPELYRTEFPSILNFLGQNRTYTLLGNNVIHSIRNILLPAFFDRYLKGRQGALLPFKFAVFFAKLGLEVESRNLNCRSSC